MGRDGLINDYFNYLCDWVCGDRYSKAVSYNKLLMHLHSIEFRYSIPRDRNRARDGEDLRYRFATTIGYDDIPPELDGPCSVLEMMVALAIRCEETIMDDPAVGNRTGQWFWGMVTNLGLGSMHDTRFDRDLVDERIDIFLDREYEPNGRGGLFTVRNTTEDLRELEIWYQLMRYLNSIS